ncbi:HAMP domain-containing sensor histidine kinase [Rhizobium sp. SSA_523]|uniref:sensor histidine kinase n=1 Tax=Rhizobium sp. SSA_523 TaxID=2952477 RepID=UPI0020909DDA|nr:PAS domain-containing sensor histidine kinase [Rhizobium sp. SSA_523]MCO5730956.1 PAS domain-containing sensor histidine kinase [Rhizobium sp. SSA_523]WKC24235.1 PAS domain-containing sensor histidine kinase [Rhizobium sp. SSA_523]
MRVFEDIGGKLAGGTDRLVLGWMKQLGRGDTMRLGDVANLRRLAVLCGACLIMLPFAAGLALGPALGAPVGAALMLATLLSFSAAGLFLLRPQDALETPAADAADAIFDACPGVMLLCDAQGVISRIGGREQAMLPAGRRDPRGLALAELVHVSDRIAVAQALDALRLGQRSVSVDARVEQGFDPQGGRQFLPVRLDLSAMAGGEPGLHPVLVQMRDASIEAGLREEIVECTAEAASAHETKSRFLAAVSHELRTPLNAILGFSDVLAGEYFGALQNERQREYVSLIRQSGGHLLSVVNTMLDMSRIEAGRYELITEPFRIAEAVETCRAMLDLQARNKGVTLTTRIARGLGDVVADRRAVQQILINLTGNAVKFTPAGGVVSIDAEERGRTLVIVVSDTGIGIAADKMDRLGQPFTQVQGDYNRAYEGTGLGLSLVKGLVSLHGGQFAIESRLGEGTVVTVTLPLEGPQSSSIACEEDGAVEFPPRLRKTQDVAATQEQGFAHDRAKAKSA